MVAGAEGDQAAAEQYNLEALALSRHMGQRSDQRTTLANLGGMLNGLDRLDEAAVYLRQALALAHDTDGGMGLNQVYALLGDNASRRGDHEGAATYFLCSLEHDVFDKVPEVGQTQCLSLVANAHERAGRPDAATRLRHVLMAHPATPAGLRKKLEAALAQGGPADEAIPADGTPASLIDLAANQRDLLG